jgi:hypothetical protein
VLEHCRCSVEAEASKSSAVRRSDTNHEARGDRVGEWPQRRRAV